MNPRPEHPTEPRETHRNDDLQKPESLATHPLGGIGGAAAGAAAGAVAGIAAGPVGSAVGAVVGAAAGVAAGAAMGKAAETPDDAWWAAHHAEQPYATDGLRFEDYAPAYRYGIAICRHRDRACRWEDIAEGARAGWQPAKVGSHMAWETAEPAVRAAFERERAGGGTEGTTDLPA